MVYDPVGSAYVDQPGRVELLVFASDVVATVIVAALGVALELVEVGGEEATERGGFVLLEEGLVAQPAARPVRHKLTSSICRRR
jgi:hypothetical protein